MQQPELEQEQQLPPLPAGQVYCPEPPYTPSSTAPITPFDETQRVEEVERREELPQRGRAEAWEQQQQGALSLLTIEQFESSLFMQKLWKGLIAYHLLPFSAITSDMVRKQTLCDSRERRVGS